MKVLLSWLREFAPLEAEPVALGEAMSSLGMAVESLERLGEGLDGIVVARVLATRAIPGANRVHIVDVDAGDGESLQIGCGAFNMEPGDLVPLATIGTVMPSGMEIGRRKLVGEWSNGMLCSSPELGLGGDAGGILILPDSLTPGTALREALGIESDVLYDLEINPNRPDAMSVAGVARDVAAHFGVPFAIPFTVTDPVVVVAESNGVEAATVEVLDPDRCGRFVARVLSGITVQPSAPAIANRLTLLGMRSINNVVDVSNYVMLELGQPNHPYDLARLPGHGLSVRRARDDETMVTLDDVERRFTSEDLLICDAEGTPVGIAGVMGGASSEIGDATTDVLLELAWFQAMPIARTARRLGLRTEASARFERGCDPEILDLAAARFCELVGVSPSAAIDVRGNVPEPPRVRLRTARVNRILGTALDAETISGCLTPIGFVVDPAGEDHDVVVPTFRPDTTTEIDVIEEVARHYGYDRIPRTVPPAVRTGALTVRQQERRLVRQLLAGLGLSEAMPMPFLAPGDIERSGLPDAGLVLANPLVAEESVLRTSLLPGLLKAVAYNVSHRNDEVGLFEIGHIFRVPQEQSPLPDEREHVAVAIAGRDATTAVEVWWALVEGLAVADAELRATVVPGMHPTRTAEAVVAGKVVGAVGEVDPDVLAAHRVDERVAWLEIDLGRLLDLPHGDRHYRAVSRQPSSDIDLAFEVADDVPAAAVERALRETAGDLLVRLVLFDVFRGEQVGAGRRSLAFALRLQAADHTLTDEEVGALRLRLIDAVERAHGAKLRA